MRKEAVLVAAFAAALACSSQAGSSQAADYPSRPVIWVVPSAGTGSDNSARNMAPVLAERLGQPVIVDNRAGAGGIISFQAVAGARPDGYTILFASSGPLAAYPHLKKLSYDPATAFTPVHGIGSAPLSLAVNAASPFRTLADLVAFARAHPDRLNYGSAGVGSAQHLGAVLLAHDAGIAMTHIPYRTTAATITDLLGGTIDFTFDVFSVLEPQIEAGRLRALAVSGATRLPGLPDVPTFVEAGYPGVVFSAWSVLMAPAGTPPDVVDRLAAAFGQAMRDPRIVAYHSRLGMTTMPDMGPAETAAYVTAESARMKILIERAGIVPE